MQELIKVVNFHTNKGIVRFETYYDPVTTKKEYVIVDLEGKREKFSKAEGNECFINLCKQFPNGQTSIECTQEALGDKLHYVRVCEHFEVHYGEEFCCSCDSICEVREEIENIKREMEKNGCPL